jgi:hypothetical protein
MTTMSRERAASLLGVPCCSACNAMGESRAQVSGWWSAGRLGFVLSEPKGCCSAHCAIAVLGSMHKGIARIVNKKHRGVIALKRAGQRPGLWPRGRKMLAAEERKARRSV